MKYNFIKDFRFNGVFIKTFIIMIIFSITLISTANYIIYAHSTAMLKEETYTANLNMLTKTNDSFKQLLNQVNQITIQLSLNPKVINAIINPDANQYTRNNEIITDLNNITAMNEYISSIYIYIPYSNVVFCSKDGIYKLSEFYDRKWITANTDKNFESYIIDTREIIDNAQEKHDVITVLKNFPYYAKKKFCQLVINLDTEKLYDKIVNTNSNLSGDVFVVNSMGMLVLARDKSRFGSNLKGEPYVERILNNSTGHFVERLMGQETLVFYMTDYISEWKFIYAVPLKKIGIDTGTVLKLLLITSVICITLSLILSFFITKSMYKPIQRLVNLVLGSLSEYKVDSSKKMINEYEFLGYAYNHVIGRNKDIEEILKSVKPVIKQKLFNNLLQGGTLTSQEINEKLSLLNINFEFDQFLVMVIQIDNYNDFLKNYDEMERSIYKITLINKIEEILYDSTRAVCIEMEVHKVAAIANFDDNMTTLAANNSMIAMANQLQETVSKCFPFTVTLGIGRLYKDIKNIKLSYIEANEALNYKLYLGKNRVIDIEHVKLKPEELYYYYSEKEKALINNITIGQEEETGMIIEEFFEEIRSYGNLSYSHVQQILSRVLNSIIELIINNEMTVEQIFGKKYNLYEELSNRETIQDIKAWLGQICFKVVKAINNIYITKQHKYVQKVREYIDSNCNFDISLNDVAEYVGLNASYLSRLFKESFGKNFSDYLNATRINKAKQLLGNTQLAIREVGFKVGFNTIQNFMRVFKKYEGITPGQFRELIDCSNMKK